jgi:hypothetical protein
VADEQALRRYRYKPSAFGFLFLLIAADRLLQIGLALLNKTP